MGALRCTDGNLLISDATRNLIAAQDMATGEFQGHIGDKEFAGRIGGVALVGEDVVASDTDGHSIVLMRPLGACYDAAMRCGAEADHPGTLKYPMGVAVSDGRVYVADSGNGRIAVFELATEQFKYLHSFGTERQNFSPRGLWIDQLNNEMFVADYNSAILVFSLPEGTFLRSFGQGPVRTLGHLDKPEDVCVCGDRVCVTDNSLHISVFNRDGRHVRGISVPSKCGGICVSAGGDLYATLRNSAGTATQIIKVARTVIAE